MYRMSLLTLLCPPPLSSRLDLSRCVKMCLVHDMAELLVGDITPVDDVPKPEKSRRESLTVDFLTQNLLRSVPGGADAGQLIRAAWQEYEDGETLESRFVHDIDKMELLLQMVEYEKRAGHRVDLEDFAYVASKMELDETKAWGEEVIAERKMFWGDRAHGKQVDGELRVVGDEGRLRQQQDSYYEKER
jgi:putative hydrolase of HD superfamily